MPDFSISDKADHEPSEPTDGRYTFVFERLGDSDERREIPADGFHGAWKGIRYYEGEEWHEWMLLGFKDLIEQERPVYENQVSLTFAQANSTLVERWDDNDEEKA